MLNNRLSSGSTRSHKRLKSQGKKLIYCALGAYYFRNDRRFWHRLIEAFASRREWTAIIGLGNRVRIGELEPIPANVHCFTWAPQMHALKHADCAVIHGGMTSVYECIHHCVPMVSYPYANIFDQFGTASRVRYHGIGVVGDLKRDSARQIVDHIDRALGDETIAGRIAKMKEHLLRYSTEQRAERAVERILVGNETNSTIPQSQVYETSTRGDQ